MIHETKHLKIEEFQPAKHRKTKCFNVTNKYDGTLLGAIAWFSKWRKYAFFPEPGMVFEEDCLRDLATFIVKTTQEHKKGLPV